MKYQKEYIVFAETPQPADRKTKVWEVRSKTGDALLGEIKWWSNWRRYCFFPGAVVLDAGCLKHILVFIEEQMQQYKNNINIVHMHETCSADLQKIAEDHKNRKTK